MIYVGQPNPFDFSDFGPPAGGRAPGDPTPPPTGTDAQPSPGGGFTTGFDPWANQPKTQPSTRREEAFGPSGDRDAFLPTDLVVRRAVDALGADPGRWRPYRSHALHHLWRQGTRTASERSPG